MLCIGVLALLMAARSDAAAARVRTSRRLIALLACHGGIWGSSCLSSCIAWLTCIDRGSMMGNAVQAVPYNARRTVRGTESQFHEAVMRRSSSRCDRLLAWMGAGIGSGV